MVAVQDDVLVRSLRFLDNLLQRDNLQKAAFLKDALKFWPRFDFRVLRYKARPPPLRPALHGSGPCCPALAFTITVQCVDAASLLACVCIRLCLKEPPFEFKQVICKSFVNLGIGWMHLLPAA